ncbi:phospholipase/carboxylesterase [Mucilaginibacter sp. OK268]|uniref:alpha/beta hydrolase n=1 Tax=Mucilaginibacter sp. OK268 TaxID=1881048 RepID=UPI0008825631|nr:dienelactone hydrolase family protein [Mucilaginibacter sp. OK268]SDP51443.1 phospholipase/carboxylesterase [Mucilaginibacter sp. OK268]
MYTHRKQIVTAGIPADQAKKAMIMLHGRGASAVSILTLKDHLQLDGYAIVAPQATEHSWYPYSFMAPVSNNQPALDSALEVIGSLVEDIKEQGIAQENIYFLGFSQGACLTLEYVTRNAGKYGGVIAFTGGLIGEKLISENYQGDFGQTPILVTTGDPDPHVPVSRVNETVSLLKKLNANVTLKIYKGRQHTVTAEELALANSILL